MSANIGHKHVCRVAGYIIRSYSNKTAAGMPDDGFFNSVAVDEVPSVDICTVYLDPEDTVGRKVQYRAVGGTACDVNSVFKRQVFLSKGGTVENRVGNGQVSRNGNGRVGREQLITVQTKPEVDLVCSGVFNIPESKKLLVNGSRVRDVHLFVNGNRSKGICRLVSGFISRYSVRFVSRYSVRLGSGFHSGDRFLNRLRLIGICGSAQEKQRKQHDRKHKPDGQHQLAEFFRFYHDIKFSSFLQECDTNTYSASS